MLKAIIIDDEQHCIDRLQKLFAERLADSVHVVASVGSVEEGIDAIKTHRPDVVFLDVQLQDKTGFDLLRQLSDIQFEVVFTTAFEQYAVQAFRFSAIDYLLKPVDAEDLQNAVTRLREKISKDEMSKKLDVLFHNLKNIRGASKKIAVPTASGLVFLDVNDIIRCQAEENYTTIFLRDNTRKMLVARTLKEFEGLLAEYNFFRVHHSHLINLAYVRKYHKGKGGYVTMIDESEVEVSTRRKEEFLRRVTGM